MERWQHRRPVEIPTVIARMKAGHGQIAPYRMEYLLFQGEEYLRTLGLLWRRINNVIIEQARGLSVNYFMTSEVLIEDTMEFSTGLGEIYSCLHNLVIQLMENIREPFVQDCLRKMGLCGHFTEVLHLCINYCCNMTRHYKINVK